MESLDRELKKLYRKRRMLKVLCFSFRLLEAGLLGVAGVAVILLFGAPDRLHGNANLAFVMCAYALIALVSFAASYALWWYRGKLNKDIMLSYCAERRITISDR